MLNLGRCALCFPIPETQSEDATPRPDAGAAPYSRDMLGCCRLALALLFVVSVGAQVPSPESHFGFPMGADRRLADWGDVVSYYNKVAAASGRVRVDEIGKTTEGRPFLLVTVASPATLASLGRYRSIQRSLADPRVTSAAVADSLAAQGKAVVMLTCSIHSTEVASTLTAMEFVHRLVTKNTAKNRAILDNVILLLVPSLNPDGVDKVASWYRRWVGTPYEGAPMTELYHPYVGHDNNRDWYIFSQRETRLAVAKIHNVWRPQIVYDVHQMGSTGARMFVPPWVDPIDPNIDPLIVQQVNAFGAAMAADLTAAGKTGVVINGVYDYFTPARHYQSYHGGLRLLSESASVRYATPIKTPFQSLQTRARGYNAQQSSWNFLEPWPGGEWTLRDIVDYQLTAFESVLYNAAVKRTDLLRNFYRIFERVMERDGPEAFVIANEQHDPNALTRLLKTLEFGMVEIERAATDFSAEGRAYSEGDYVIRMRQPYAAFARTLLEPQRYPDLREYPGGPPRRPYDVTAHSLPLLMGVETEAVERLPADLSLAKVAAVEPAPGSVADGEALRLSPAQSNAFVAVNRLLADGVEVFRNRSTGEFHVARGEAGAARLHALADELGLRFEAVEEDEPAGLKRVRAPRVALYAGFTPIMDEGWTRWVLERFEFPYSRLDNARLRAGDLQREFDVVILPDAQPRTLHGGYIEGASYRGAKAPPEYTGGIGDEGARALREFVESGGTLLTFNRASSYAIERLRLPVEDVLDGVSNRQFYSPGALLKVRLDPTHPLCWGMREEEAVWFESGPAFRRIYTSDADPEPEVVLRYPRADALASGWLLGEEHLASRAAVMDVPLGRGRVVLFGIRPQYRAQPNATFKLLFNGLFYFR